MASNLHKYKCMREATASKTDADAPSNMSKPAEQTEMMDMKAEILSSLKMEIAGLFQIELKTALAAEFGVIKSELQAVKSQTIPPSYVPTWKQSKRQCWTWSEASPPAQTI